MKCEIGMRAADEIRRTAYGKCNDKEEAKRIGIRRKSFYDWDNGRSDPSTYNLQKMALAGYDVHYILTGERLWGKEGGKNAAD